MYYHKPKNRHHFTVGVMNTSPALISWLSDQFGGSVYQHRPRSQKEHWKQCWEWRMKVQDIPTLLPPVIPYLVIKKRSAELAVEFRSTFGELNPRKDGITKEILGKRNAIMAELKRLNIKGKPRT